MKHSDLKPTPSKGYVVPDDHEVVLLRDEDGVLKRYSLPKAIIESMDATRRSESH